MQQFLHVVIHCAMCLFVNVRFAFNHTIHSALNSPRSFTFLSNKTVHHRSIRPSFRVAKRTAPDERPAEDGDGEQPKRIKTERQTSAVVQPLPPTGPAAPPSPGPGPAAPAPGPTAPPPGPAALQDIFPGIECPICLETHQEVSVLIVQKHLQRFYATLHL